MRIRQGNPEGTGWAYVSQRKGDLRGASSRQLINDVLWQHFHGFGVKERGEKPLIGASLCIAPGNSNPE
jgi:hypothetical protein